MDTFKMSRVPHHWGTQIKASMTHHFISTDMAAITKKAVTRVDRKVVLPEPSCMAAGTKNTLAFPSNAAYRVPKSSKNVVPRYILKRNKSICQL